jgi:hypothetical protein
MTWDDAVIPMPEYGTNVHNKDEVNLILLTIMRRGLLMPLTIEEATQLKGRNAYLLDAKYEKADLSSNLYSAFLCSLFRLV